jgi:hypothetical protein
LRPLRATSTDTPGNEKKQLGDVRLGAKGHASVSSDLFTVKAGETHTLGDLILKKAASPDTSAMESASLLLLDFLQQRRRVGPQLLTGVLLVGRSLATASGSRMPARSTKTNAESFVDQTD